MAKRITIYKFRYAYEKDMIVDVEECRIIKRDDAGVRIVDECKEEAYIDKRLFDAVLTGSTRNSVSIYIDGEHSHENITKATAIYREYLNNKIEEFTKIRDDLSKVKVGNGWN